MRPGIARCTVWLAIVLCAQAARAQYITGVKGYNLEYLTPKDKEVYASKIWTQAVRGSMALVFPGNQTPKTGKEVEDWIVSGKPVRAVAFTGMPTTSIDNWAFGKELAVVNAGYARSQIKKSKLYQKAVAAITRTSPELKKAAETADLSDPNLVRALEHHAQSNPGFARVLSKLKQELSAPVVVLKSGWTDAGINIASPYYAFVKRPLNERRKASIDSVAGKVARLLVKRFKRLERGTGPGERAPIEPIALVGHCSGSYHAAEVAFRIRDDARGSLRHLLGIGIGAAANFPRGMRSRNVVSAFDRIGQINSPTEALLTAKLVRGSHMLSKKWASLYDGQEALKVDPISKLFKRKIVKEPAAADPSGEARLERLEQVMKRHGQSFSDKAREVEKISSDLDPLRNAMDKTLPSYRIIKARLKADSGVLDAKAMLVDAAGGLLRAKRYSLRASAVERSDPILAQQLRTRARQERARAKQIKSRAVRIRRDAVSELHASVKKIPRNLMTDFAEYEIWKTKKQLKPITKILKDPIRGPIEVTQGLHKNTMADIDAARHYSDIGSRYTRQTMVPRGSFRATSAMTPLSRSKRKAR